jgi:hypothetical protein
VRLRDDQLRQAARQVQEDEVGRTPGEPADDRRELPGDREQQRRVGLEGGADVRGREGEKFGRRDRFGARRPGRTIDDRQLPGPSTDSVSSSPWEEWTRTRTRPVRTT